MIAWPYMSINMWKRRLRHTWQSYEKKHCKWLSSRNWRIWRILRLWVGSQKLKVRQRNELSLGIRNWWAASAFLNMSNKFLELSSIFQWMTRIPLVACPSNPGKQHTRTNIAEVKVSLKTACPIILRTWKSMLRC